MNTPKSSLIQKLVLELIFLTLVTIYLTICPAAQYNDETVTEYPIVEHPEVNPLIAKAMVYETETEESDIDILKESEVEIEKPLEPAEPKVETVTYYDVPLSEDLQDHLFKVSEENNIDPALVLAMIQRESSFRATVKGDHGESYGLMQIKLKYNHERMKKLGCDDLLDPYQNITVGIDILVEKFEQADGKPLEWVLMAYNGGNSYANKKWAKGEISEYVEIVKEYRDTFNTYEKELTEHGT